MSDNNLKLILSRAYPPQLYDLSTDPEELLNLANTGHPEERRLTDLAEATWSLDHLLEGVIRSQPERKLIAC